MISLNISHTGDSIDAQIHLSGSKSISNRVLIIRALSKNEFILQNLSESKDTSTLMRMLSQQDDTYDAGHAGTSFRFMTAYLAIQDGEQILTGSGRMKQRPIGPLVDALNAIGGNIEYVENEGYPPLKISSPDQSIGGSVDIPGDISSQFLSALLLIGPYLDKGLELNIIGELVSRPYLQMTLDLIKSFGADVEQQDQRIVVNPSYYKGRDFYVEGDWSSASYLYEICALAPQAKISISGLHKNSLQGDARISEFASKLGIKTSFLEKEVRLTKENGFQLPTVLEFNLIEQPDLCQTLVCICAGLGVSAIFSGLKTLKIKETDRIDALNKELQKMNVFFTRLPSKFSEKTEDEYYMLNGKIEADSNIIQIETYEDHRMAMAFAPLSVTRSLAILEPNVVVKSYPSFWNDLQKMNFIIQN